MKERTKLDRQVWLAIIILGLVGQLAWMVENFYFNTFLFKEIGGTTKDIRNMVALSGIVATVTTIFMGAWSDKLKKRKIFISLGYIIWGIVTLSFAFISKESLETILPSSSPATVISVGVSLVIILDCIMTFFGSTANDAAFNAWITETTDETNRGSVEGVLGALPLLAMLLITGLGAIAIDLLGYGVFFGIIGLMVILCGVGGMFLIKEEAHPTKDQTRYFQKVIYGFRPSTVKANKKLYLTFLAQCFFSISFQVFMTYILIYFEHNLGYGMIEYGLMLTVMIIASSVLGIILGRSVDRKGKAGFGLVGFGMYVSSLFLLALSRNYFVLMAIGTILLTGDILLVTVLSAKIRDETPKNSVGLFQGVRLFFVVLIPMVIGPTLGEWSIRSSTVTFLNEFGETVLVPNTGIFWMAGLAGLLVVIPFLLVFKPMSQPTVETK